MVTLMTLYATYTAIALTGILPLLVLRAKMLAPRPVKVRVRSQKR